MLPHLSFFFTFSLLFSSLIFSFENTPAPFPGWMSLKATKSGFIFCV